MIKKKSPVCEDNFGGKKLLDLGFQEKGTDIVLFLPLKTTKSPGYYI